MVTSDRCKPGKQVFACMYLQDGNCRKYLKITSKSGVGDITRPYRCIPSYTNGFNVGDISYQFTSLPFGNATALLEFTMIANEVKLMALVHRIRIRWYIDNLLVRASSQHCVKQIFKGKSDLLNAWVG